LIVTDESNESAEQRCCHDVAAGNLDAAQFVGSRLDDAGVIMSALAHQPIAEGNPVVAFIVIALALWAGFIIARGRG
jgi:hypothetical protein